MNFKHAVGFLFLGTIVGLMPRLAPGWCHVTDIGSASARELWLQFMSFVQIGLAGAYFFRRVCAYLGTVMEYDFATSTGYRQSTADAMGELAVATEEIAMVSMRRPALAVRLRPQTILPLPVAFKSGLLEQRRAA